MIAYSPMVTTVAVASKDDNNCFHLIVGVFLFPLFLVQELPQVHIFPFLIAPFVERIFLFLVLFDILIVTTFSVIPFLKTFHS